MLELSRIGSIIKNIRVGKHITAQVLSEDVCSENYVYLVEKGSRVPSVCGR